MQSFGDVFVRRTGVGVVLGVAALVCNCGKLVGIADVPANAGSAADGRNTARAGGPITNDAQGGSASNCLDASLAGGCSLCRVDPLCTALGTVCSGESTVVTCAQDSQGCFYQASSRSCGGANSTCSAGACVECAPGFKECAYYTASNSLKTCGANGKWEAEAAPCDNALPWCIMPGNGMMAQCVAPPSCGVSARGTTNCGVDVESCCTSLLVTGGTFYRTYTNTDGAAGASGAANEVTDLADPTTVSSFRMDKYLVTVGRFRRFVQAWMGSASAMPWRPAPGAGIHTHVHDAKGLLDTGSSPVNAALPDGGGAGAADAGTAPAYEPGWQSADADQVMLTDDILGSCDASTWTPDASGPHENLPINCINWFEAEAFCIWDRGYLPSEAEWEYAAAGGNQQREYPWGSADPGTMNEYAIYYCYFIPGSVPGACPTAAYIAPVGSAPQGQGLWGQLDLAGNVWEYTVDWYVTPYADSAAGGCVDCANTTLASPSKLRVVRGGNFRFAASYLAPSVRGSGNPKSRVAGWGARCVRPP